MAEPTFTAPETDATKERPILFSAPMVRALLAGTKTQTRRVMTLQPHEDASVRVERFHQSKVDRHGEEYPGPEVFGAWWDDGEIGLKCPYGQPGDTLWVRETWQAFEHGYSVYEAIPKRRPDNCGLLYAANDGDTMEFWRPSIHMPRWASRILLEITAVRVERLQDISEADARAEGITFTDYGRKCGHTGAGWVDVGDCPAPATAHPQRPGWGVEPASHEQCMHSAPAAYASLWEQINGAGSWNANPWVWVVEFRIVRAAASMGGREG